MSRRTATLTSTAITAAFIGPGTVTVCAKSGAAHGLSLLWALAFATVACFVLQEAAARLTAVTGRSLGQVIAGRFPSPVRWLAAIAVISGCAAYQAGNILGAVAGTKLVSPLPEPALTTAFACTAFALLAVGSLRFITAALASLVALMGIAFATTAISVAPPPAELIKGLTVPTIPGSGALLVLGLVGTTVVPYNLFLGSALAHGHELRHTRTGLAITIAAGGLISMAVLVTGSSITGEFSFANLATVLSDRLGPWAKNLFALGLAAAGLTSAVTAPLAAAFTARSLFLDPLNPQLWSPTSARFRAVWATTLLFGTIFGITGIRPVPAIILAQSLNGLLLPLVAILLWRLANDRTLLPSNTNKPLTNLLTAAIVALTLALGTKLLYTTITALL
ncbi:MAG: Nramp family divalent metal transporter [Verrucomicrobiales bacterium]|nr:Nramp family divalent metal transporter [Verrucomicrobiales bacterium]